MTMEIKTGTLHWPWSYLVLAHFDELLEGQPVFHLFHGHKLILSPLLLSFAQFAARTAQGLGDRNIVQLANSRYPKDVSTGAVDDNRPCSQVIVAFFNHHVRVDVVELIASILTCLKQEVRLHNAVILIID
jgi:hypothetical protein